MSFTVDDFPDLLRLLREHPEWQAELRVLVLAEELLELPALMRQLTAQVAALAEAQQRTDTQVAVLAEAQTRTEARLEALAEAQVRTEARLEALTEAQVRTESRLGTLTEAQVRTEAQVHNLVDRVGHLQGDAAEQRYRTRAGAYFSRLARRLRVVDISTLADQLTDAVAEGRLADNERDAILLADLVLSGRRPADDAEIYLLAEISVGIGPHDVERAAARAAALEKLGRPVLPIVAGDEITPEAAALARMQGVWSVLDGRSTPPSQS